MNDYTTEKSVQVDEQSIQRQLDDFYYRVVGIAHTVDTFQQALQELVLGIEHEFHWAEDPELKKQELAAIQKFYEGHPIFKLLVDRARRPKLTVVKGGKD